MVVAPAIIRGVLAPEKSLFDKIRFLFLAIASVADGLDAGGLPTANAIAGVATGLVVCHLAVDTDVRPGRGGGAAVEAAVVLDNEMGRRMRVPALVTEAEALGVDTASGATAQVSLQLLREGEKLAKADEEAVDGGEHGSSPGRGGWLAIKAKLASFALIANQELLGRSHVCIFSSLDNLIAHVSAKTSNKSVKATLHHRQTAEV